MRPFQEMAVEQEPQAKATEERYCITAARVLLHQDAAVVPILAGERELAWLC